MLGLGVGLGGEDTSQRTVEEESSISGPLAKAMGPTHGSRGVGMIVYVAPLYGALRPSAEQLRHGARVRLRAAPALKPKPVECSVPTRHEYLVGVRVRVRVMD